VAEKWLSRFKKTAKEKKVEFELLCVREARDRDRDYRSDGIWRDLGFVTFIPPQEFGAKGF
jgi:hypothetical protein